MDTRQSTIFALGIVAMAGLFAVVYAQFSSKQESATVMPQQGYATERSKTVAPAAKEQQADPQTPDEVATGIDAQLSEDSAMLESEMATESSDMDAEANSMNDLSQSYDENAY